MKSLKLIILAAAVLTACHPNGLQPDAAKAIRIKAGIAQTKVATSGDASAFEPGDQLALYAWINDPSTGQPVERVVDGGVFQLANTGVWSPLSSILWFDMVTPHYFIGVYPANSKIADLHAGAFTLNPADQAASDLLIATNLTGLKANDNPVSLTFEHAMARLRVNLNFRNQWDGTPTVSSVAATAATTATVNYETKAVTAGAATASVSLPAQATPAEGFALSYGSLMVPQAGFRTLTITIEGKEYVFTHSADIPLASGKTTVVNLTMGRDKIELASDITIKDWTAGDSINGEAQDE